MAFPELPDNLIPRRGTDMSARDYADVVATAVGAVPEEALPAEIERLDRLVLGANDDLLSFALGNIRMLLRTRQLALQHDPENADKHVRNLASNWAEIFAEYERRLHGSGNQ